MLMQHDDDVYHDYEKMSQKSQPFRVKGLPGGNSHVDVPRGGAGMDMNIKWR